MALCVPFNYIGIRFCHCPSRLFLLSAFGSCSCCVNLPNFQTWPCFLTYSTAPMPPAVRHTLVGMIHRVWHGSTSSVLSPAALPRTPSSECSPRFARSAVCVLGLSTGYPHSLKCPLHPLEQSQHQISVPLQLLFVQQLLPHPRVRVSPVARAFTLSSKVSPWQQAESTFCSCSWVPVILESKLLTSLQLSLLLLPSPTWPQPHLPLYLSLNVSYCVSKTTAPGLVIH